MPGEHPANFFSAPGRERIFEKIRELDYRPSFFAQALKNHGNEVRVIATGKPADYKYAVRQMRFFPVVEHLITSQGMRLAIPNRHVFEKAAAWADVVHFMMPSPLGIMGLKHVEKLGIPHTAAFHCQPENITFTLHMGNSRRVNDFVYNRFRDTFFNRFTHIHCPSNMIANQLRQHGYTARLHVISNGISREEAHQVGFQYLDSPNEIMAYLKEKYGEQVRILAIPGYNSTPIISNTPQK